MKDPWLKTMGGLNVDSGQGRVIGGAMGTTVIEQKQKIFKYAL